MNCKYCGNEINENDEFCGNCGKSLTINNICPFCGTENEDGDIFCGKCGKNMSHKKEDKFVAIKESKNNALAFINSKIDSYKEQKEKNKQIRENQKKQIEEMNRKREEEKKKQLQKQNEMISYAYHIYIENEGNEFKVINAMSQKYNIDTTNALYYINQAKARLENEREKAEAIGHKGNEIKRTAIISSTDNTKSKYSLTKGAIGGALLGPIGFLAGNGVKTESNTTFLIEYYDGSKQNMTVKTDSFMYRTLCKYLNK